MAKMTARLMRKKRITLKRMPRKKRIILMRLIRKERIILMMMIDLIMIDLIQMKQRLRYMPNNRGTFCKESLIKYIFCIF